MNNFERREQKSLMAMERMFVQQFIVVVKGRKNFFEFYQLENKQFCNTPTKSQENSFQNRQKLHNWFFLNLLHQIFRSTFFQFRNLSIKRYRKKFSFKLVHPQVSSLVHRTNHETMMIK